MSRILLAPMEGLADWVLRDVLTRVGGYDAAVSEFVRVSGSVLPPRAFFRICPELLNGCRTPAGVPMAVQLLGSDPGFMAANAAQLAELGPPGIDLNFGCPAPTVNRHGGGASLLDDPVLIGRIVRAVRDAVPAQLPVTAKMRLGLHDTAPALVCARAIEDGGAARLVVHARTRDEFYRPPAHWEWVARIREAVRIPVVANGEVWTLDDYRRCREVTGCADVMIGRGAVADPFLARRIQASLAGETLVEGDDWPELRGLLALFWRRLPERVLPVHAPGRLKLWLKSLRTRFAQADALYLEVRSLARVDEIDAVLRRHGIVDAEIARAG
ncbi:tRNA-dihydrouridine synthase family protein [uncultured Propionivibrio sp.]|uniref:tRNA dihydrouridine synthase n=1 Tax=uncultured Propionivibrio sp. TaxID=426737 RepID=UPI0029C03D04|nr:tRNA-dihydrouridine synthase family protein [uncultured Propionivibrio sp.]